MRSAVLVIALSIVVPPLAAQGSSPAPRVSGTLPSAELAELERVRAQVWIDWFAGDTAALRQVLTPELVAISPDSPEYQSLDATIAGSARFHAGGASGTNIGFTDTRAHRFGDVVVMFSRYSVTVVRAAGTAVQQGRATEVFVRHNGRWVHTSWHLDVAS